MLLKALPIINRIAGIVDKVVPDKAKAQEINFQLQKTLLEQDTAWVDALREIAVAEVKGHWFQAFWRPTLSWLVIFMWPWNFVLRPLITAVSGVDFPEVDTASMTALTTIWGTVYGFSRTMEKTGSSVRFTNG